MSHRQERHKSHRYDGNTKCHLNCHCDVIRRRLQESRDVTNQFLCSVDECLQFVIRFVRLNLIDVDVECVVIVWFILKK